MIQLLFALIFAEMALILVFVFKTPLRKLVIMGLDRVKRGRGPIIFKTVAGTVLVVMLAAVYKVVAIQRRWIHEGEVNPTEQILLAKHLLEASLMDSFGNKYSFLTKYREPMDLNLVLLSGISDLLSASSGSGFSLFLALIIDRLHHYIRELRIRRKTMEAVKKQNRAFEDSKPQLTAVVKALEEELAKSGERIKQLETELQEKSKEVNSAETNAIALKKQSEGFLLEYDRLLEENQSLRSQLQSLDRRMSFSESKKVM
ncbi:B-cell receptor-associated 31-like [Striga asiatica]|uniref:Endoplasmic reticulum transmembrane protein n=1 Tax=Striga asiatica TaxID=4170 RepID=A0A5A7R679_STRAF|nr:B-cell receptor-associated 31-like [Striga asiatica]